MGPIKMNATISGIDEMKRALEDVQEKTTALRAAVEKVNAVELTVKVGGSEKTVVRSITGEVLPENVISVEKLAWMESVGISKWDKRYHFVVGGKWALSPEYLINTPLEELKTLYERGVKQNGESSGYEIDDALSRLGLTKDKIEWLISIGVTGTGQHFDYDFREGELSKMYSAEYLAKTPIELLKTRLEARFDLSQRD